MLFISPVKPLFILNPLSANPTKWSSTLKQFVRKLPTNCLSVFDHFAKLELKRLRYLNFCPDLLDHVGKGLHKKSTILDKTFVDFFTF